MAKLENGEMALAQVVSTIRTLDNQVVAAAMYYSDVAMTNIAWLDRSCERGFEMNISIETDSYTRQQIGVEGIEFVGAAMNASAQNSEVALCLTEPAAERMSNTLELYRPVGFDFDLLLDGEEQQRFSVPVQITMPVPVGACTERMIVRHFLPGGEERTFHPVIGTDGACTFVLTAPGTIVFAARYPPNWNTNPNTGR